MSGTRSLVTVTVTCLAGAATVAAGTWLMVRLHRERPYLPLRCRLFGARKSDFQFSTPVCASEGLQGVVDVFQSHFLQGLHQEAQLCVYAGGQRVLDTWGTGRTVRGMLPSDATYDGDTVQTVYSTSKTVCALVFGLLVEKGCLAYEDPVVKHWPQFALKEQHRAALTVADVLQHRAQLPAFVQGEERLPPSVLNEDFQATMEEWVVHRMRTEADAAGCTCYHAVTTGPILQAICMRADPHHRTMQQIIEQEMMAPLGVEFYMGRGLPPIGCRSLALVKVPSKLWALCNIRLPHCCRTFLCPNDEKTKFLAFLIKALAVCGRGWSEAG